MNMPVVQAVMGRVQQAVSMVPRPLGIASNTASRGFDMLRSSPAGLGVMERVTSRPRMLGLGVSSDVAGAGQQGRTHVW